MQYSHADDAGLLSGPGKEPFQLRYQPRRLPSMRQVAPTERAEAAPLCLLGVGCAAGSCGVAAEEARHHGNALVRVQSGKNCVLVEVFVPQRLVDTVFVSIDTQNVQACRDFVGWSPASVREDVRPLVLYRLVRD